MWHISHSLLETHSLAKQFLYDIKQKNKGKASVVGLYGDLGSGKTTFTKAIAGELGVKETVTSPTFIIQKKYKLPENARYSTLTHIDAYRLESSHELAVLGWEDLKKEKGALMM